MEQLCAGRGPLGRGGAVEAEEGPSADPGDQVFGVLAQPRVVSAVNANVPCRAEAAGTAALAVVGEDDTLAHVAAG